MTLENQVVSLEVAKRLKKLGVTEESYFCWFPFKDAIYVAPSAGIEKASICAAYTVAELGIMLPDYTDIKKVYSGYFVVTTAGIDVHADGRTEADARARMLIYLLENKLIEL